MAKTKKTPKNLKAPKQLTLDNLPDTPPKEANKATTPIQEKQIIITEIGTNTKEDELALKVAFTQLPSKTAFSKIKSDLWFDNQQISSIQIRIPQGPLAKNGFELTPVLDMKGITAGTYTIKIEMYEPWSTGERLTQAAKEISVEYVPQTRESKFVKVPTVKSVAGTDLAVVSESEKDIYREINETEKKELVSERDEW